MAALIGLLKFIEYRLFVREYSIEFYRVGCGHLHDPRRLGCRQVYYKTAPGVEETFMDKYEEFCIAKLKQDGAAQEELADMKEIYKNPFARFGITLTEILPVGIIIVFVSAGVLRKREILPA